MKKPSMENELINQIRHECRNGLTCIQYDLKRIAEAYTVIGKAIIEMANEQARIERAINYLDRLEKEEKP